MEILEVKIRNFLSIDSATLKLDKRGVLLISGENGAGKSSLTSKAICWGLFGETVKGMKGDGVVNVATPSATCSVEIYLQVGERQHVIKRQRNPTSLELDGQRFRLPGETQRAIEHLVGRDHDSFMAADYFGQDRPIDFLGMTPTSQMETMEGILRLSRLDTVVKTAKDMASAERILLEAEEIATRQRQGQIQQLEQQGNSAQERHSQLQLHIDGREQHRRKLQAHEDEIRRKILKGPVNSARVDAARLKEYQSEIAAQIIKHDAQDSHFKSRSFQLREELDGLCSRIKDIEDEVCPTCGGAVHKDLTAQLRAQQEHIRRQYQEHLQEQTYVTQWLSHSSSKLRDLQTREVAIRSQLAETTSNLLRFDERMASINENRATLDEGDMRDKAVMNELVAMIDRMVLQRTDLEKEMALHEAASKRAMNRLSMINYWIEVFGKTFKHMILEQALPFLQERTEYHLRLLNNSALKVTFSTQKTLKSGEDRQQFTVVASRDQGGQSELALSGGERQMVSFAVGLALSELADSQTGSPSNLMILDEPFTMLDETNCEAVVQYVTTELIKRKATILLISNDERMKALIPGGIHVRRGDDGYSRVI